MSMPFYDGITFYKKLKSNYINLPFVFVSGAVDENKLDAFFKLGGGDFILKNENYLNHLPKIIETAIIKFRLSESEKKLNAKLSALTASLEQKVKSRTLSLISEIEERKAKEEELRVREEEISKAKHRIEMLVTSATVMIYACEAFNDFDATFISDNIFTVTGYTTKEFLTKGFWASHIHPDDAPEVFKGLEKLFENNKHNHEYRFKFKNGTYNWMADDLKLVKDENGNPIEIIGAWNNIDKRKNAENEIKILNANLEAKVKQRTKEIEAVNKNLIKENKIRKKAEESAHKSEEIRIKQFINSPIGMLLCKMDGTFVDINPACANIIGRGIEESLKLTYWDVTPKKYAQQEAEQLKNLEETGRYGPYFKEYIHKNGHLVPVELSGLILEINNEKFIWSSIQDITERKRAENEIKAAKLEAEKANLAKSEFLSRMSHELRTPMNSILGFAQLMKMGELNQSHKKGITHIIKSGKHLLDLINEVLDLSRIEAGELSISLEPVELGAIILETLDIVQPLANEHEIKIELKDSPINELFIIADRQKLKQVLLNLINNAVKFNHNGGSVIVECSRSQVSGLKSNTFKNKPETRNPEPESKIRINITDSGEGIAAKEIEKLFKPFQRIGTRISEIEGTGLGLTVAKKFVEAMDGTIGLESTMGVGSTFWIELRQVESQIKKLEKRSSLEKPKTCEKLKKGLVLYIEDNASNIDLVEQILETYHPDTLLVTGKYGEMAVKLASDYKPCLILLDLDLPDIHGSTVFERLQANDKTKDIPVVIVSADAMTKQIDNMMKQGAKDYLTKPIDVIRFLKLVEGFLVRK
jgi:PAS domain S-box-containing protein